MYTQRMFDMWNSVTSKLEAHANTLGQSNVQSPGQNNSSGSIKGNPSSSSSLITNTNSNSISWKLQVSECSFLVNISECFEIGIFVKPSYFEYLIISNSSIYSSDVKDYYVVFLY